MDLILGTLGFMQMTCLPGLILYRFFKIQAGFFDKILMVFGLSLIANYILVFAVALLGIYTQIVLIVLILAELIAIFWLFRNKLNTAVVELLTSVRDGIDRTVGFFFPAREKNDAPLYQYFLRIILLLLSARSIVWALSIFMQNLGTVFSAWDAVVSWNKWAVTWASNAVVLNSSFYPQLIPINWSITYVLLGSPAIQFFAKALMPVFAVLMLLGFFSLCIQTKQYYYLISLVLLHPLLKDFINTGLYDGYVDIAAAYFTFATLYALIRARSISDVDQRSRFYLLGALFSAGAALSKQTGVYVALCYPVLVLLDILVTKIPLDKEQRLRWISSLALVSLLWASWYVFKAARTFMDIDPVAVDVLISLSADKYENVTLVQQVMAAVGQYRDFIILFILVGLTFPWMDRFHKWLTLLFVPYPILWAWMASYDTRNLAIFLPVLALIAGYAIHLLLDGLLKIGERINVHRARTYVPLTLALLFLLFLNFMISPQDLYQKQVDLQKQIFSPNKNQLLYELVEINGPQTRILTNYPMSYLPGLEGNQVFFNFDDYSMFLLNVQNPEIEYILLPNVARQQVKDYIDQKVNAGDYQIIARDRQWKTFTLIRILNRD